jgi:tyrosinase
MQKLSRRIVIGTGAAAAAASAIPLPEWLGGTAQASTYVRYEASTTNGQAMLAKYQTAVAHMKLLSKGDPCSWIFQAYTHWIEGAISFASKPGQVASLPSAQQALANAMWDTCQNHGGQTSEDMFLPWHRLYVYYLERICRHVLGDSTFTLPYWNYNAAATNMLPGMFRTPANTGNSLWYQNRNPNSNAGGGMASLTLSCLSQSAYSGFSQAIDNNPHGQLHVDVGNNLGMGNVPYAALDPIFYLHHCNIDRLWASWNAAGRANPTTSSWTNQTFTFADPGYAGCTQVTGKVGDVTNIANLGYSYDRLEPVLGHIIRWPFLALETNLLLLKGPGPVELGVRGAQVLLSAPRVVPGREKIELFNQRLTLLKEDKRIYLLVDGLMADRQPGVSYDVYLDPAERASGKHDAAHLAGTINFFGAVMPEGARKMSKPQFSFDVTDILRGLSRLGPLGERVTVSVVPHGQPAENAKTMVEGISFVEA